MDRRILATVIVAVLTAACSAVPAPSSSTPSAVASTERPRAAIPVCATIQPVTAPQEAYRDQPIYVANEMPTDEIRAWAATKPGFADLWIDRERGGWITVAFTEDADARQTELATTFPGVGVVAVQVDRTASELEALQQQVADELAPHFESLVVSSSVRKGTVEVGIGVLSDERIDVVRSRFAGQPVCVDGIDVDEAIPQGPQPISGDGWRLLASDDVGEAYRTGIAADLRSYRALWRSIGILEDPPSVDFETEVVIWLGAVYGSSCPDIRLDDIVIDLPRRLVHGEIVLPSVYNACTADANPRAFVVAVERSALPPAPFAIQLGPDDPPAGAPEERSIVEVDLRDPGSVAKPGDVHPDPSLPEPGSLESGSTIEPGFEVTFRLEVRCGIGWLGRLNDVAWRTEVPDGTGTFIPAAWAGLVRDDALIVSLLLRTDPEPTLTATAAGLPVVYRPTLEAPPHCP